MTYYTVSLFTEQKLRLNTEAVCEKLSEPLLLPQELRPQYGCRDDVTVSRGPYIVAKKTMPPSRAGRVALSSINSILTSAHITADEPAEVEISTGVLSPL